MRRAGLVWFSVLSLSLLALPVCYLVLLLEGCPMTLLVNLTVAVEGRAAVKPLRIHSSNRPVFIPSQSVFCCNQIRDPGCSIERQLREIAGEGGWTGRKRRRDRKGRDSLQG